MSTGKTIALLVAALLVLSAAGCGTGEETTAAVASTTGAPQTTTTGGQTVGTTTATEQMTTSTTTPLPVTTATEVLPGDGLDEEYDVYSAFIQSAYHNALIVIEDTTAQPDSGLFSVPDAVRFMRNYYPELGDEIWSDFQTKNQTPMVLERRFTLSAAYVFISKQELESIFASHPTGWEDFYAKYPGSQGELTLSRVGFNEAKDTAIFYAANQSHWVAGEGNMVVMEKTAGRWTVLGQSMMWIS